MFALLLLWLLLLPFGHDIWWTGQTQQQSRAKSRAVRKTADIELIKASRWGDLRVVHKLLDKWRKWQGKWAVVDSLDKDGRSALSRASQWGHLEVVQALLSARAKVDIQDKDGASALSLASRWGNLEVVHTLLSAGANADLL